MGRKAAFILITVFWVTMNALLWRAEFGGKGEPGSEVSPGLVWQKILTSPDDSGLAVLYGKERVGYLRWAPNIGEETATGKTANENTEIEGRVKKLTGYTVHSDGNFIVPESAGRFRFEFDSKFLPNGDWEEWKFKGIQKPNAWSVAVNRKAESIELGLGEGPAAVKQAFRFADFRNPQKLVDDLGIAGMFPMVGEFLPARTGTNGVALSVRLNWEARQDWLQMGHSRARIYRLEARLLDKYRVVVLVSRVGEILRVDLPGDVTLVNEALINL
jgi:hypothetical protein